MKRFFLLGALLLSAAAACADPSPYQGEETHDIKALGPQMVAGLESGEGLGFAKAAELNHYPGPRHVLDLAGELGLSDEQVEATRELYEGMRSRAIALGRELVDKERALDALFANDAATPGEVDEMLAGIGATRARLRGVHLKAHIDQKQLLTTHQVHIYDKLRGYDEGMTGHGTHMH